ncbi:MAG: hypothetical protein B6U73_00580 [Desulfurococcales archaeon ex4484_204]|nr:MAG: hypothetical protein B6U73_00580 [Desulfurococcales archaeon ex4484_204]
MFRVTYPDGSVFKKMMLGVLKPLDEVPIKVSLDEFLIRSLSPDKNILIEVVMPRSAFESFDCTSETSITASRDQFLKVARRATKRDSVTLVYEEGSRTMRVVLVNARTGTERFFEVELSEAGRELIQSLQLDLPVRLQIASEDLKKLIRDSKIIGEELELTYKEGFIEATVKSEGRMFKEILTMDKPLYSLESKESTASSKYDVDMLRAVVPAFDVTDLITLEFGSGLPLKISMNMEDGSRINIWIAPRA